MEMELRLPKEGRSPPPLSLAKTPSTCEINNIDCCFAQAIRNTSVPCSKLLESLSHRCFAFSARIAASCSKTWFSDSNSPP
jgi:hypothetical protein